VPSQVAADVSSRATIPTIGIGAGHRTDGQVLVLQDLLGLTTQFKPKFVRHFANGAATVREAIASYIHEVRASQFPSGDESYE
jgi:3-methyl-2-oxobutanoate hydroxymethyltransferase